MNLIAMPLLDAAGAPFIIGLAAMLLVFPVVAAIVTVVVRIIRYIRKKKNVKPANDTKEKMP